MYAQVGNFSVIRGPSTVPLTQILQNPVFSKSQNPHNIYITVVVWTQNPFTPLLTRPQGSQGCQKIRIFFLQMKLLRSCAKIAPERHKLWKLSKLKKKCQKNPVLLDFFEYSSNWGQSKRTKPQMACLVNWFDMYESDNMTFHSHNGWTFKVIQAVSVVIWKESEQISPVWYVCLNWWFWVRWHLIFCYYCLLKSGLLTLKDMGFWVS
jgi:hypothetical protein